MKYMIMMFGDQSGMESQTPEWIKEMVHFMHKFNEDIMQSGEFVDAQGLTDASQAKTVRFKSGAIGTVHATTVTHPQQGEPYNVALVDCDEGFRLMSRVEAIDPIYVKIGMRVRFRIHKPAGEDPAYPVFVPAEGAQ